MKESLEEEESLVTQVRLRRRHALGASLAVFCRFAIVAVTDFHLATVNTARSAAASLLTSAAARNSPLTLQCAPELLGLRKLSKEEYEEKAKTGRVISEACDSELDRLASEFQGKVQRGEITQPPLDADGSEIAHGFSSTAAKGKGKSAAAAAADSSDDSGAEGTKKGKKAQTKAKKATVVASGEGHAEAHLEL